MILEGRFGKDRGIWVDADGIRDFWELERSIFSGLEKDDSWKVVLLMKRKDDVGNIVKSNYMFRFKFGNSITYNNLAILAQSAARKSHNLKVVSSSLTYRIFYYFYCFIVYQFLIIESFQNIENT